MTLAYDKSHDAERKSGGEEDSYFTSKSFGIDSMCGPSSNAAFLGVKTFRREFDALLIHSKLPLKMRKMRSTREGCSSVS